MKKLQEFVICKSLQSFHHLIGARNVIVDFKDDGLCN